MKICEIVFNNSISLFDLVQLQPQIDIELIEISSRKRGLLQRNEYYLICDTQDVLCIQRNLWNQKCSFFDNAYILNNVVPDISRKFITHLSY